MTVKTDLRTNDTKERIVQEAQRLYQVGGYNYMGLDKIAETLNIKRPALYHHFPDGKEQLLVAMVESFTREKAAQWQAAIEAGYNARSRFKYMLLSIIKMPLLDMKRFMCVEAAQLQPQTRMVIHETFQQLFNLVQGVFQEGIERGELRPVEMNLAFFTFMGLCEQVETIMLMDNQTLEAACWLDSPEVLVEQMLNLWLDGLSTRVEYKLD